MKVATAKEMQEIDRRTTEGFGISGLVLMERAGVAVAGRVKEAFGRSKVLVLAGSGNNGGDGLVVARELHNSGFNVRVAMVGERGKLSPGCKAQLEIAKKMRVPVQFRNSATSADFHSALVVDAIFGTGLSKEIKGPLAALIAKVNASGRPVVAVDIPSGVSADTGRVLGAAIKATHTVTFGLPKRGHYLHPGAGHAGRLFVEDIGFPRGLFDAVGCELLTHDNMAPLVPVREAYSHKGDYGHVLVVAGSRGKTGAALMAARAALRAGAGLVTIGVPEGLVPSMQAAVREEMLLPLPEDGQGALSDGALEAILRFLGSQADVLAIGPGIGRAEGAEKLVRELTVRCTSPMVLDADAVNALAGRAKVLEGAKAPVVITPHPGEFSRLSGLGVGEIEADRAEAASAFSREAGVFVVLKGAPTVIGEPEGRAFINSTGNPGMATAGSGDVLTGVIASLIGQGLAPVEASTLGVYLHGLAGDIAASCVGGHSLLATDITEALPGAFSALRGENG